MAHLVSTIIPCYNSAHWVAEALDSLLAQTRREWEAIVVDDGSTDDPASVVGRYSDPRIRLVRQENRGLSGARNAGIANAQGDLFEFLDADDRISPDKHERLVKFLDEHPDIALVAGGCHRTDESWQIVHRAPGRGRELTLEDFALKNQFPVHASLIRRECIAGTGEFDESLRAAEDWDYHLRMLMGGFRIHQVAERVCDYRALAGSMSGNPKNQTEQMLRTIGKTFADARFPAELLAKRPLAHAEAYLNGAIRACCLLMEELAREYLAAAIRDNPALLNNDAAPLFDRLVYWCRHPAVTDAAAVAKCFLKAMPKGDSSLRDGRRRLMFLLAKDRAFLARDRGDEAGFVRAVATAAIKFPAEAARHLGRKR